MSLNDAELFLLAEEVRQVRRMPFDECIEFLERMAERMKDDTRAQHYVRSISDLLGRVDWHFDRLSNGLIHPPVEDAENPNTHPQGG